MALFRCTRSEAEAYCVGASMKSLVGPQEEMDRG